MFKGFGLSRMGPSVLCPQLLGITSIPWSTVQRAEVTTLHDDPGTLFAFSRRMTEIILPNNLFDEIILSEWRVFISGAVLSQNPHGRADNTDT